MTRWILGPIVAAALMVLGCDGTPANHPSTTQGAFDMIEGAVNDLAALMNDKRYKSTRDLGSDSDRISLAMATMLKNTADTPLAADAEEIRKKFNELEKLGASRAPVDQQRQAVKDLQDTIAAIKAKL